MESFDSPVRKSTIVSGFGWVILAMVGFMGASGWMGVPGFGLAVFRESAAAGLGGAGLAWLVFVGSLGVAAIVVGRTGIRLRYRIENGELVVPAHFARKRVKLGGAVARRTPLTGALRMGGTGIPGVLYLGFFRGCGQWLHCAATDIQGGWLLSGNRTVYISPADNERFAEALRAAGATLEGEELPGRRVANG